MTNDRLAKFTDAPTTAILNLKKDKYIYDFVRHHAYILLSLILVETRTN